MQEVKPHIIKNEHVVEMRMSDGFTATRTLRNDRAPDITWSIPLSNFNSLNKFRFYKFDLWVEHNKDLPEYSDHDWSLHHQGWWVKESGTDWKKFEGIPKCEQEYQSLIREEKLKRITQ